MNEIELLQAFVDTFQSPSGKKVLEFLIDKYVTNTSHVPGDPYTTAWNEGRRTVIMAIINNMNHDMSLVIKLREQQLSRNLTEDLDVF